MSNQGRQIAPLPLLRFPHLASLRWRLPIVLGAMFLSVLLLFGTGIYQLLALNEQRIWEERQREVTLQAAETVNVFMNQVKDSLILVSQLGIDELHEQPAMTSDALLRNAIFLEVAHVDHHGRIIAHIYQDVPLLANMIDTSASRWFAQRKTGAFFAGDVRVSDAREPYLIVAAPTSDGGMVAARLRINLLRTAIQHFHFGENGHVYVLSQAQELIAYTQPAIVLQRTNLDGRPEVEEMFQAPDHAWHGQYVNVENRKVIGISAAVAVTNWVVVTELPQAEATAVSRDALLQLIAGMTLFGLLVIGVTVFFLDRLLLQPLAILRTGAERIGQGDLSHRLDIQRQDEVGRTAMAFNQMAAQLWDRAEALRQVHDELETRIQERTAALAAANQELRTEIEERTRAEQALRESEQRYRTLFETAPVSIFTRDREGRYTSINTEALRYWTTNPVGHTLAELLPAEKAQEYRASDLLVMETGRSLMLEQQFPAPHGLRMIFTHKVPLRDASGNITGILGASLDITERRQAETALHEAELKYRQLVEQLPVITYTAALDEAGTIIFISPQLKLLGFSPEEWMTNPDHWLQYLHPDDFEHTKTQFDKVRSTGERIETEYRIFTPDGRLVWIRDEGTVVSDAAGQPLFIQGVMLDITQQKQAEEALHDSVARIRLIADHLPALIAYVDDQQVYRFANKRFEEWYVTGDIGGKHLREVAGVASYEGIQQYVEAALSGTPVSFEYSRVYPDGRLRYVQISYIPHFGPAGKVLGFFTLVQDLTERKQAEEQIKASLEEKVVLLKEIHHRVKNNLQVISSLLYLQNAKTKSPRVRDILQDSQNRVKSMALIHEKLYQAKDLAHVDLSEYVRNLTGYLWRLYTAQASNVQLKVKVDNVFLGIDTAMPCGLIINELVSNSFKHAFPNSRSGQIAVELQADQERDFVLSVRDNGVGFPTGVDFRNTPSLGLQLVNTLVRQLNGSIELHRNGGVEFMIRFTEVK